MAIRSLEALEKACENKNIYDVILEDDCMERGVTREESEKKMADLYAAIQHSAQNYTPTLRSASGMAGAARRCAATSRRERRSAATNWGR